jgi:hypothetical protein
MMIYPVYDDDTSSLKDLHDNEVPSRRHYTHSRVERAVRITMTRPARYVRLATRIFPRQRTSPSTSLPANQNKKPRRKLNPKESRYANTAKRTFLTARNSIHIGLTANRCKTQARRTRRRHVNTARKTFLPLSTMPAIGPNARKRQSSRPVAVIRPSTDVPTHLQLSLIAA